MRFAFTDDQLAYRDAVRDLLSKECPPEVVRSAWPDADGDDARGCGARADADRLPRLWRGLADMGVFGVGVPVGLGGLGLGEVDWVLLAEETGYAAVPQPFVETACVGAPLLGAAGDPTADLADVLAGRSLVTTAIGGVTMAPWAGSTADGPGVLVLHGEYPLRLTPVAALHAGAADSAAVDGSRRLAPVSGIGDGVAVTDDRELVRRTFDRGMLGTAAQLVGLGRRMLDMTVAYVSERRQFGVPVGSFQAVKHHLADAALGLKLAAPAVYRAAWSCATDAPTRARDVSMAKVMAGEASTAAGRAALQCHGAIGYTVEYDLHLFLKRSWALSRAWGDAAWHRDRVGRAIGV